MSLDVHRGVSVFTRSNAYILGAVSRTEHGAGLITEPLMRLGLDASADALGSAILTLVARCRNGVETPRDWKAADLPLLRAAGVRSWRQFAADALLVSVEEVGDALELVPNTTQSPGPRFEGQPALALRLNAAASPPEIGAALMEAFDRCRTAPTEPA